MWLKKMEEGACGKVGFISRANEILMINLTPRRINLTFKQMEQICKVVSSPLTVHIIPKIL